MRLLKYLSKLDPRWKNIDILLKYNFENVELSKDQSEQFRGIPAYDWFFTQSINGETFQINVSYSPCIPVFAPANIKITCEPDDLNSHHLTKNLNNDSYRNFMINGVRKISHLLESCYTDVIIHRQGIKNYRDRYDLLVKSLTDALPKEDLEEILSDMKDLTIGDFNIESHIPEFAYYGYRDPIINQIEKPCYIIRFSATKINNIDEFAEFGKLLSISSQRIKNTYDMEVKYDDTSRRLIIW